MHTFRKYKERASKKMEHTNKPFKFTNISVIFVYIMFQNT